MATVSLLEAQTKLSELIHALRPGEEVIITENSQPIARLQAAPIQPRQTRRPGTLRGTVLHMAPDFDAPLDDFKEYME
ncbi:MAG: type II toxin-antitoxin system prevent-host-death family antitoxin [Methylococcaceae bacterium]|nr:type II toxin-antitoxin system prevent-host-death family antitoxin [Methylococcaceae bacterium]